HGESHAEVGDRANDALRIDGEAIRAKVVGEGANLGVTQRGRVAYALKGGRIDTDAIDNSAGVSMSDHEVNIKILLGGAIAAGVLGRQEREPLLAQMAGDVASLVLRDNYLQGEALSVAEARGAAALDRQVRLIRDLERAGRLDRGLEFLPDHETLRARTGGEAADIARSYRTVREVFELPALWAEIEALDNQVPARVQIDMLLDVSGVVEHEAAWLLRANRLDPGREIARFAPAVRHLATIVPELLPSGERALFAERAARFAASGVPQPLASRAAGVIFLTTALEVGDLAERARQPV